SVVRCRRLLTLLLEPSDRSGKLVTFHRPLGRVGLTKPRELLTVEHVAKQLLGQHHLLRGNVLRLHEFLGALLRLPLERSALLRQSRRRSSVVGILLVALDELRERDLYVFTCRLELVLDG